MLQRSFKGTPDVLGKCHSVLGWEIGRTDLRDFMYHHDNQNVLKATLHIEVQNTGSVSPSVKPLHNST